MIKTVIDIPVSNQMIFNYFNDLVNCFFKILPIREHNEPTLTTYIHSLQIEILGAKDLIKELNENSKFITLVSILEYLKEHPDMVIPDVKREVFKAINICNKIKEQYSEVM